MLVQGYLKKIKNIYEGKTEKDLIKTYIIAYVKTQKK